MFLVSIQNYKVKINCSYYLSNTKTYNQLVTKLIIKPRTTNTYCILLNFQTKKTEICNSLSTYRLNHTVFDIVEFRIIVKAQLQ